MSPVGRIVSALVILSAAAAAPAAAQSLTPENCLANSVLPATYQAWQQENRWMGVAVSPQNPTQTVHLEMMSGTNPASLVSYSPPAVSRQSNGTSFLVRNFNASADQWIFPRASTPTLENLAHVVDWDAGQGSLYAGPGQTLSYGDLAYQCGLIRVFGVGLEAGSTYRFYLTGTQPADDVRMALFWTGSLPDGWIAREEALFEKRADAAGSAVPYTFTPEARGGYGLAVFVNDVTAAGGMYTVRFEEYVPPSTQPDLTIASIEPAAANVGQTVHGLVRVANLGALDAPASTTRISLDGGVVCGAVATPAIPAGGSATVSCNLGTLTAGNHTIAAVVDQAGVLAEGDETNNEAEQVVAVASSPLPDLTITEMGPLTVPPNHPSEVWVRVANIGGARADTTTVRYLLDYGARTVYLPAPALDPGESAVAKGVLPGIAAGTHHVDAVANHFGTTTELTLANNGYGITLTAEGADLVCDGIAPTAVIGNVAPVYEITVRNAGTVAALATRSQLAVDGTTQCLQIDTPPLAPAATTVVTCASSLILTPGGHDVEAFLDVTGVVPENDENNNHRLQVVTATPTSVIVAADGSGTYPTIQAAIDAVASGGEVLLAPGTFTGVGNRDLDFHGKDLTVIAAFGGVAVIDCQGDPDHERRAFHFHSGETNAAEVVGLTIVNGWSEYGAGGGVLIGDAQPTIRDCIIRDCHADKGGAVAFSSAFDYYHPRLEGCTLTGNSANFGDAVHASGNIGPYLENTLIASNFGYYGAVVCDGSLGTPHFTVTCCDVWGNGGGDWVDCLAGLNGSAGNIGQNPLFCAAGADDYHLAANSPCASAMNPGCGRIGALDAACGPIGGTIRHVNAAGTGEYLTIQHAINNSVAGDVIELADGVYSGTGNWDVNPQGRAIVIRSASGDPYACRIDGQNAHRGFVLGNGEGPTTMIQGIGVFNGAAATGGGIACTGASPTLEDLYLADCAAGDDGGGLHCINYASPTVRGCRFENCSATDDGGGLYAYNWSSPTIEDCEFIGNLAGDRGAGATFSVNSFPTVDGCTFRGNEAVNGGGVLFVYAYGQVSDCVFENNVATYGGGMQGYGNAQVTFTGCTFSGNRAPSGAQIYLRSNSSPSFTNCLLAFGELGAAFARYASDCNPTLACSDIHGNALGDWTAMISAQAGTNGNFSADPLFCDRLNGDLTLRGDSPCAMANNAGCGQVGALAVGCSGVYLVRPDGAGDFPTIQAAIDAAVAGETIVLADGVFTGAGNRDLDFKGKAIAVRSQSGDSTLCVIDCEGSSAAPHWGVAFQTGETAASVLERLTIRNAWRSTGAGGRITAASPTLRGVIFRDNTAGDSGAGLILGTGAAPRLEGCLFLDNDAANAGGGIYVNASYPQVVGCRFEGNTASWGGGGMYNQHASPNVLDCTFAANASNYWGGAVHNRYADSAPSFTGCVFTENTAPQGGAVYCREGSTPSFMQCTFAGNSSANGAILHFRSSSVVGVVRSILAFSPAGAAVTSDGTGSATLICSDVYGNAGGDWAGPIAGQAGASSNFSLDPYFCDRFGGLYALAGISPCLAAHSGCGLLVGALGEGCAMTDVAGPGVGPEVPATLTLEPCAPNPFNPTTRIVFWMPREGTAEAAVYGLDGRLVSMLHRGPLPAGRHELVWRGRDDRGREAASGIYLIRVKSAGETRVAKMALMR